MANSWFKCKEFTIRQDRCAMKVGTDGVILGAWADLTDVSRALDVGTGTGLIALMLAQRSPGLLVDAIEIEKEAAKQAGENIGGSKYSDRIRVKQADFSAFSMEQEAAYDLVVCNPPFFSKAHKPGTEGRLLARHDEYLTLHQLFKGASILLTESGRISIIIPFTNSDDVFGVASGLGFYPQSILHVIPVPGKQPIRACITFVRKSVVAKTDSIIIETGGRHAYSKAYRELTGDFYLDF